MVDSIFNRVRVALSEPSVQAALKKVREGLKTPNTRRTRRYVPRITPRRAVTRTRQATGSSINVARDVGQSFRRRFEALRKLSLAEIKNATAAYGRGLTNLALGRRAGAPSTDPPQRVEGPAPVAPVPVVPPIQRVAPAVVPVAPPARLPARIVIPPPPLVAPRTVNNYLTNVTIDPRNMLEWRQAMKLWEQLKRRNRAAPKPSRAVVYDWMSPEEKEDLQRSTFTRKALESAGFDDREVDAYLTAQATRAAKYAALDAQLRRRTIVKAEYKFREERITRFKPSPFAKKQPRGPSGAERKRGQFYTNKRFQGAVYSVPTMTRNRKLIAAARPMVERARQRMYGITGQRYVAFRKIDTKPVKVFYPSKWGTGAVKPMSKEAVDAYWIQRLTVASKTKKKNQPLLRQLLQND